MAGGETTRRLFWHRICRHQSMSKKMTFEVDRTSVAEGDVVEVRWDCTGADRVELKIDNGYKASVLPLDISGSKRFRLNRSKGRTALTITAWKDGQHGSKTLKVRVTEIPTTHAETVDSQGRTVKAPQQWWQRMKQRIQALPSDKRTAFYAACILVATLLLTMLSPRLLLLGLLGLLGYLLYVVWRR